MEKEFEVYFFSDLAHQIIHYHRLIVCDGKFYRTMSKSSYHGITLDPSFYASEAYDFVKENHINPHGWFSEKADIQKIKKDMTPITLSDCMEYREEFKNPKIKFVKFDPVYICPQTGIVWKPIEPECSWISHISYEFDRGEAIFPKYENHWYFKKVPKNRKSYNTVRDSEFIIFDQKKYWEDKKLFDKLEKTV